MTESDVIVIGAGIIGAACAWQLAARGQRVTLVDDGNPGATAAGMGHLVCMDDDPAELALSARSLASWRKLTPRMLNELIEKIEVFNAEKVDGVWEQRLRIHDNCVGAIEWFTHS